MKSALFFILLSFSTATFAQFKSRPIVGAQMGIVVNLGTHQQKLGVTGNLFYHDFFYQLNLGSQISFNFNSYGERKMFWENRTHLGAVLLVGKQQLIATPFFDGLQHQTNFNYGIAYNYLWYYDDSGTSQRSGAFGAHIKNFFLAIENDVFGGQARDRFRTSIIYMHYRTEYLTYFIENYLWTGETRGSTWTKVAHPYMPNGFRDLSELPFGKTSHGILNIGVHGHLPYHQWATVKVGIDDESIRNFIQNKLGHDLIFLPKKMKRNTPHYPMLDNKGCPVFEKEAKRKTRFYFAASLNNYLFD